MSNHFFAMISRMKLINRWGLMRNTQSENISEHSHQCAVIAHALAVIGNEKFGRAYNAERAALLGLYHDATEIITGDLPTPVKYYNDSIISAYKAVEETAGKRLLAMLPEELRPAYAGLFEKQASDAALWPLVKAADKLCALMKCMEEEKAGNGEFSTARQALERTIQSNPLEEVQYFVREFLPSYALTLDEHTTG
ncbi:MAG: 5'-deoxynucleotidase [Clostridiales bacterium]|nr:5'-deoxynucleotidase [Clostridiales bacterium]